MITKYLSAATAAFLSICCGLEVSSALEVSPQAFRGPEVVAVGDWDSDGVGDFAIGDFVRGRVRVVSGAEGRLLNTLEGEGHFGWSLAALDGVGSEGRALAVSAPNDDAVFVYSPSGKPISKITRSYSRFGTTLQAFPDKNGDGEEELLVGSTEELPDGTAGPGKCEIVSIESGRTLLEFRGEVGHRLGKGFAVAPDLNGDGLHDILAGVGRVPQVVVYSGKDGMVVETWPRISGGIPFAYPIIVGHRHDTDSIVVVGNPDASRAVALDMKGRDVHELKGENLLDRFGAAAAFVDDLDGDDVPDYVVGAPGAVKAAGLPMLPQGFNLPDGEEIDPGYVQMISAKEGRVLWEGSRHRSGDWFGISLCTVGDVDGDGFRDICVASQLIEKRDVVITCMSGSDGAVIYEITVFE